MVPKKGLTHWAGYKNLNLSTPELYDKYQQALEIIESNSDCGRRECVVSMNKAGAVVKGVMREMDKRAAKDGLKISWFKTEAETRSYEERVADICESDEEIRLAFIDLPREEALDKIWEVLLLQEGGW